MQPANALRFALNDRIQDAEVGPAHVPLKLLGQFQKDVTEFLTGSGKDIDPNEVIVSIEDGSLALVVNGLLAATSLWADLDRLREPAALGMIDSKRAAVVSRWQAAARKHPYRRYAVADHVGENFILVNSVSNYRDLTAAIWVPVEKYLQGKVTQMGGTNKGAVELQLDSGKVLHIASGQQEIADEERNRVYKPAVLHVSGEENLDSGELRNLALLGFEVPKASWDEAAFKVVVRKGTQAWADVPDDWLENLRSGHG